MWVGGVVYAQDEKKNSRKNEQLWGLLVTWMTISFCHPHFWLVTMWKMIIGRYWGLLSVFSNSTAKSHFSNRDWAVFEDYSATLKYDCLALFLNPTLTKRTGYSRVWVIREEILNLKYTHLFWKWEHIWGLHHSSKIYNLSNPHICSLTIRRSKIREYIVS